MRNIKKIGWAARLFEEFESGVATLAREVAARARADQTVADKTDKTDRETEEYDKGLAQG